MKIFKTKHPSSEETPIEASSKNNEVFVYQSKLDKRMKLQKIKYVI